MTIQEQLSLREDVFLLMDAAIEAKDKKAFNNLLEAPQPDEWIKRGDSEFYSGRQYEYNDIELVEAILSRITTGWCTYIISTSIVQDKGQFAVTTTVVVQLIIGDRTWTTEVDGVATTYAQSIKHLTLSTPKSVTDAVKNACKRIGNLLGRSLNRGLDDLPSIQLDNKEQEADKQFEEAKTHILTIGSYKDAHAWLSTSAWKYNNELKHLINTTYLNQE